MGRPKIALYGVGQVGQHVARFALDRGWHIVAAYNRAGKKIGRDLGRVAGLGRDTGVIVQDCATADYTAIDADIGVVATTNFLRENFAAYQGLVGAGMNVVCHGTQSYDPYGCDPGCAREIDELAKGQGVTFAGGGIWDMSRIWAGILVTGPCTGIQSLHHKSITDCSRFGKEQMLFTGVDATVDDFAAKFARSNPVFEAYKTISQQVVRALGYTLADTQVSIEPVVLDRSVYCEPLARYVSAGDALGTRIVIDITTVEGLSCRSEIELRIFEEGEVEHMAWSVAGQPRTRIRVEREDSLHASASSLFNRIPDVIAAPPGIVLLSQLGPLRHSALS